MLDRPTFQRYIRDAFNRLDDPSYLATHSLASTLFGAGQSRTPEMLRRALLNAIAQLRPPEDAPRDSIGWRRWRALTLRHVDGATSHQIARDLRISLRQAQRDQLSGIEAIAAMLWAKREARESDGAPEPSTPAGREREDLQTELTRAAETGSADVTGVDLADAVASAAETLREVIARRGAQLAIDIPPDLNVVAIDRSALRQIILCLLGAALGRGDGLAVRLSAINAGERVEIRLGLDSQTYLDSAESLAGTESAALLDTVGRLVELEHGALTILPSAAEPTWVTISLPAALTQTVLVIDDNPDLGELFRAFLAGSRFRVVQARTVPQAFRLAREIRPDVITLDVLMPSQDGWQVLQQLRSDLDLSRVPVIVCSIVPERPLAMSLGADGFLAKPVSADSLRTILEATLTRRTSAEHQG